jgi:hypothetical protein
LAGKARPNASSLPQLRKTYLFRSKIIDHLWKVTALPAKSVTMNPRSKTIRRWVELILRLVVPGAAVIAATFPELFFGKPVSLESLLRLALGLIAANAVTGALERYGILAEIENQITQVRELSNVELLHSAQDAGVIDVYPRANPHRILAMIEAIKHASGNLDLCGVAWPVMVENEQLREAIVEYSKRYDVRILLLDPECEEAERRANIEAPMGRKTIADINTTMDWIQIQQIENKRFRLHFYDLPPILSLLITNHYVFEEAYHFGRPEGVYGCIGGHVPMLKIRNQPELETRNPYAFYKAHFEYLYSITRGSRVTLRICIEEAKASAWVSFVNQMDQDIDMTGWQLSGQGGRRPFSFPPNFTWGSGKKIVIAQNKDEVPTCDTLLQDDGDFLGDNAILRLTNAAGTLVGEWSMPLSAQD